MADGMSHVDYAAQSVLSSSELLLASPSNAKLTTFYPVPSECTSVIAQSICNTGQLFVSGNSKAFGTSTNYQISSANIIDTPFLEVEITIQNTLANSRTFTWTEDGWLYGLIKSFEVTYSNSNISNLVTRGSALRDWNLSQQTNRDRRERLLKEGGEGGQFTVPGNGGIKVFKASVPLSFLNWGAGCVSSPGFPFDARTINGIIQVQVNWAPDIWQVLGQPRIVAAGDPVVRDGIVPQIKKAQITMRSYQLLDSSFSVGNALAIDPTKRYVLPAKWLNSYTYEVDLAAVEDGETIGTGQAPRHLAGVLELNSAPAGMLQGIILHVRPTACGGAAGNLDQPEATWTPGAGRQNRMGGLRLNQLQVSYSGQNIIRLDSMQELDSFMKYIYGDEMKTRSTTDYPGMFSADGSNPSYLRNYINNANPPIFADNLPVQRNPTPEVEIEHQTYIIPFMHDGEKVFRERHFENLPQYSGSALSLKFQVLNGARFYSNRGFACFGSGQRWNQVDPDLSFGGEVRPPNVPLDIPPVQYLAGAGDRLATYLGSANRFTKAEVTVTYVMAALLQNSNGMVEIQL